ncbi:hypothetical protein [Mucilaginibacter flavus]|uniref:hypothetical protein n=1 Tax=Mucilaginibacter flavus TaxID=931504 RepID=UPI0025B485DF|nr:hypothetical protein [Mucilaginibacter flavus]MDN3579481.1 hypothetical protein [Mucilaginibacter flavus]
MRKALLVTIIALLNFSCSERHRITKMASALGKCESEWKYFTLTKPIKGIVLLHTKGYCGFSHTHANTIIIVNNTDTIRVNGPCYTQNIDISDSVIVTQYDDNGNVTGAAGDGKYDCSIKKTCYGLIKKIK